MSLTAEELLSKMEEFKKFILANQNEKKNSNNKSKSGGGSYQSDLISSGDNQALEYIGQQYK